MNNINAYIDTKSGLKIIVNNNPNSESVAVSFMIRLGSIYETEKLRGSSHLIEHLMFKGTSKIPDKLALSRKFDSMGAIYNAYTDYNLTSYHIKVQKKFLESTINLLGQIVSDSLFREDDFNNERPVVIEELIKNKEDEQSHLIELYHKIIFNDTPYGNSIGGNPDNIKELDYKTVKKYWKDNYCSNNLLISVSGNTNMERVIKLIESSELLNRISKSKKANNLQIKLPLQNNPKCNVITKDSLEQTQLVIGFPTFGASNPDKFGLAIIKTILAGNMSSRLFTKLRDDYGLAYSVSGNISQYEHFGEFNILSGVDSTNLCNFNITKGDVKADALSVIINELFKITKEKVSETELQIAKDSLIGGILLDFENNQNISEFYGRDCLLDIPINIISNYTNNIKKVTISDIYRISNNIIKPNKINVAMIGNIDSDKVSNYLDRIVDIWDKNKEKISLQEPFNKIVKSNSSWFF